MPDRGTLFTIAKWIQIILLLVFVILLIVAAVAVARYANSIKGTPQAGGVIGMIASVVGFGFVNAGLGLIGKLKWNCKGSQQL